jgi:hypothetical protein
VEPNLTDRRKISKHLGIKQKTLLSNFLLSFTFQGRNLKGNKFKHKVELKCKPIIIGQSLLKNAEGK